MLWNFAQKKNFNVNFLCAFCFSGILMINTLMFSFFISSGDDFAHVGSCEYHIQSG